MRHQIRFQFWYDGDWHDVPTYQRSEIVITDGQQDKLSQPSPARLTGVQVNNRDGRYSPDNAMSPLYGKIGRATRCRLIVDGVVEFVGEIEGLPVEWTTGGIDVWVPVTAHSLMYRLGLPGSKRRAKSAMKGTMTRVGASGTPRGWWPLERQSLSNLGSDAAAGEVVAPFGLENAPVSPLGSDGAVRLKSPDSIVGGGVQYEGVLRLPLVEYTPSTALTTTGFLLRQARNEVPFFNSGRAPMRGSILISGSGTVGGLRFSWSSDPDSVLGLSSVEFGDGLGSGAFATGVDIGDGEWHHIQLVTQESSGNLNCWIYVDGELVDGGVVPSVTLGAITAVHDFGATYFDLDQLINKPWHMDVCHVAVFDAFSSTLYPPPDAMRGYDGEQAHERIQRIFTEAGIPVTIIGSASARVGPQPIDSTLAIAKDAAAVDMGLLWEDQTDFGFVYRCHSDLYNQAPALVLTWGQKEIGGPLLPKPDLDFVENDVTVKNKNTGGEVRLVQETGSLNVQDPTDDPQGVGPVEVTYELNLPLP